MGRIWIKEPKMKSIRRFVLRHFEESLIVLILFGILAIALLVHYKFAFLNFFFLPVILSGYFLGRRQAVLSAIFCVQVVVLYLIFSDIVSRSGIGISLDEAIRVAAWGGFLILTGAIIGTASEQRESRMRNLKRAYVGVLEILLKYMEVADEKEPRSMRVSALAGRMAESAGLEKREVENIKSAALLYETGDLRSSLPFFEEVIDFMAPDTKVAQEELGDRESVMLKSIASLLREIEPLLSAYFYHYVRGAQVLDKDLDKVPIGSSLIALADIYDRIVNNVPLLQENEEYHSLEGIEKLGGRAFPPVAVYALQEAVSSRSTES